MTTYIPSPYFVNKLNVTNPCGNEKPISDAEFELSSCKTFSVVMGNGNGIMDIMEDILNAVSRKRESASLVSRMEILIQNHVHVDSFTCIRGKDTLVEIATTDVVKVNDTWYAIVDGITYQLANLPFLQTKVLTGIQDAQMNVSSNKAWVVLCGSVLPNCSKIFIENEDYIIYQNNTVYLNEYNMTIGNEEFDMWDTGILTCINYLGLNNGSFSKDNTFVKWRHLSGILTIRGIISIVCSSLSLLALLLTFVTYCCFPSLRTLPGKCVMSLTISLFFAQLLFSTSNLPTRISILCLSFSVLQHYCWLSAFAWMNVLSFTICQSFSNFTTSQSQKDKIVKFRKYSAFAWLVPFLVIMPCMVLHFIGSYNITYTRLSSCWLKEGITILFFFAIPIGLILLINICLFIGSVCAIHKTVETAQRASDRGIKEEIIVYARLSTIMGLTWVVGFLSPFHDVLAYAFIVLNGLQGVAVFVSFVLQRSVYKLVKREFGSKDKSRSTGSQVSKSPTMSTSQSNTI